MTLTETPPTTPTPAVTPDVFDAIVDAVNAEVLGRTAEVRAVMLALIAKAHVFALSRPGEAKSMMLQRIIVRISGASIFSTQLDAQSGDNVLFGNWSVKALTEDDQYRRSTSNQAIQYSHVAVIEEIARASAGTLSSLLRILVEREYQDAGVWKEAKTSTMLSSANSLPWIGTGGDRDKAENLAALWDRIAVRLWMEPTTDLAVLRAILELPKPDPAPRQVLAWSDVEAAQLAASNLPVEPATYDALIKLVRDLGDAGIAFPSPRRLKVMVSMAQANAWLSGSRSVKVEHLDVLTMVFPHTPDEQDTVDKIIFKLAAPEREAILKLERKAGAALVDFNTADSNSNDRERAGGIAEAYTKCKRTAIDLAAAERKATAPDMPYINRIWPALEAMHVRFVKVIGGDPGNFRQDALAGKVTV